MKKLLTLTLALVLLFIWGGLQSFAASEEPIQFAKAYNYGSNIYYADWETNSGWGVAYFRNEEGTIMLSDMVKGLPERGTRGTFDILRLCFYNNKFYFLAADYDWEFSPRYGWPGNIYSCDPDGGGLTLLAENVGCLSEIIIVNHMLYYSGPGTSSMDSSGLEGGLYAIDLNDLSVKKFCDDQSVVLHYCDGNYAYFSQHNTATKNTENYIIRTNGTGKMQSDKTQDDLEPGGIRRGNYVYYISEGQLYVRNLNSRSSTHLRSLSSNLFLLSITSDYILCCDGYDTSECNEAYLSIYRFSRWASNSTMQSNNKKNVATKVTNATLKPIEKYTKEVAEKADTTPTMNEDLSDNENKLDSSITETNETQNHADCTLEIAPTVNSTESKTEQTTCSDMAGSKTETTESIDTTEAKTESEGPLDDAKDNTGDEMKKDTESDTVNPEIEKPEDEDAVDEVESKTKTASEEDTKDTTTASTPEEAPENSFENVEPPQSKTTQTEGIVPEKESEISSPKEAKTL